MTDIYSKDKRSKLMSKIRASETKPEILVRKALFAHGLRFRKNDRRLPGKPDIVLPKYKTAIFTNGCFWHGHTKCKAGKIPLTNKDFWDKKIRANTERDKKNLLKLKAEGWQVIILWTCQLNTFKKRDSLINSLITKIKSNV